MKLIDVEGLVIKKVDYKASKRLITIFTKEHGILTLGIAGISGKKTKLLALSSPLSISHFQIKISRGNHYFVDGSPLLFFDTIRSNLSALQISCEILKCLASTQLAENPAPLLFDLTQFCLVKIDQGADPYPILALFLIKMLKHEGLISISSLHLQEWPIEFSSHEHALIKDVFEMRHLNSFNWQSFSLQFLDKVRSIFKTSHS